jgi:protein O-mannosyl-transferase
LAQPLDIPAAAPSAAPVRIRGQWIWLAATLAIALGIHLTGLFNLPVFDDAFYSDGELKSRFSHFALRPRALSYGTFVWIEAVFGDAMWKQRLANMAMHLATVAALWLFYREILRSVRAPEPEPGEAVQPYHESQGLGLAIAFFALNPVAVYAVAYLIQRSIVMATLFVVLGLWLFARGLRTGRWWLHALAIACYALAVLSKEHAVLAPLAALAVFILVARPTRKRLAIVAVSLAVLIGVAAAVLAHRLGIIIGVAFDEFSRVYLEQLRALNPQAPYQAWPLSIENQAWLFFEYGFRWFLPVADWMSISMRPPFPATWWNFPQVLGIPLYLGLVAGASVLLLRFRDWRALAGFSLLLPALLFPTEFTTVWVQDPFVLYRSYLWAIGVPGVVLCFVHGTSTRALVVIFAVVALLLSWQAVERVVSLATPETAWSDAIGKLPNDPRAVGRWFPYLNRGSYYVDNDRLELAMRDFESSAALGDMGMGSFNAGSLLNAKGRPQQALAMFDVAEKQGYILYSLPFQRGLALAALGRTAEAYKQFETALLMTPPSPTLDILRLQRGRAALQIGKPDVAVDDLTQYLAYDPANGEARYLLAMAHIARGQPEKALAVIDAAPPAVKANASSHYARAAAYYALKRKREAMDEIDAAVRANPQNAGLREWQAKIRAMP